MKANLQVSEYIDFVVLLLVFLSYPRLRKRIYTFCKKFQKLLSTIKINLNLRMIVGLLVLGITIINISDSLKGEVHWHEYITLFLLAAMCLFWFYTAILFTNLVHQQKKYFSGELYADRYEKYITWLGEKEEVPIIEWIYYCAWLAIILIIYYSVIDLKILECETFIQRLNAFLLIMTLILSGNSVLSTVVFTFFLCDIYNDEIKATIKVSKKKSLEYNRAVPHTTIGVQKLLNDAQAHSTCYLAYALCYVIILNLNVTEVNSFMNNDRSRVILVFMGMICFGLYIVCTIGARYYLRRIVDKWRMEQLEKCQNAICSVSFSDTTKDLKFMESYTNRIEVLEKCKISLLPSYQEVLFTAAIGVFSKDIILYLFGLFADIVF